MTDPLS